MTFIQWIATPISSARNDGQNAKQICNDRALTKSSRHNDTRKRRSCHKRFKAMPTHYHFERSEKSKDRLFKPGFMDTLQSLV